MPSPLPNPKTGHSGQLPALHLPTETPNMDEPRTRRRTTLTLALLLTATVACTQTPKEPQTMTVGTIHIGEDHTVDAHIALADLDAFLTSVTTTTTTPRRSAAASQAGPAAATSSADRWDQLAQCEAGGRWDYPPVAGGFSGGLMFHIGTWRSFGGLDYADDAYLATREQQIDIAERVLASSGWRAWPGCSRKFGWL